MIDLITNDSAMQALELALTGLSKRQEVVGQNLSNVDTPGYLAQSVNFEGALKMAMGESDQLPLRVTHASHLEAPGQAVSLLSSPRLGGSMRADGNNVDINIELNQMAETSIRYQAASQLASKKLVLLRAIAQDK